VSLKIEGDKTNIMTTDKLEKANELKKTIDDYKNRIRASVSFRDETCSLVKDCSLSIQTVVVTKEGGKEYTSDNFGTANGISEELKKKVVEEIQECAIRIARIFEREIKHLEEEFESL